MNDLARACEILLRGGVGAIPTETVYGLAADAGSRAAVERIYAVKRRPLDHPVIVHLGEADWIGRWARTVSPLAEELIATYWPGPLTLVLPRARGVGDWVTGGQDTVGLRMPSHPLTLGLLKACGLALAAPSANRFGRISPTTAQHVREDLGDEVDFILDGGPCLVGLESTILDLSTDCPRVLRPGGISVADLEVVMACPFAPAKGEPPRVPGRLASHYAPQKPTHFLKSQQSLEGAALLSFGNFTPDGVPRAWERLSEQPREAGRQLYAALRRLDASEGHPILIQPPPQDPAWESLADRLRRAVGLKGFGESTAL